MSRLFRLLFPKQHAALADRAELERAWRVRFSTLQRSPLDESRWVSKFVALDGDYKALEQEVSELRVENLGLKAALKILQGSK
jgi:hypothetical protein